VAALTFNVVYEDAGDGWVFAHVPELPEVHTQGPTPDYARETRPRRDRARARRAPQARKQIPSTGWALVESIEIAA